VRPDAQLHAAAVAGGPEAFGAIVARYMDAVFGVALARVGDFHAAEDIAQNVLIAAYERLGSLKDPSRLGAWLRSMAIHRSIDYLRARRAPVQDAAAAMSEEPEPAARLERKELRQRVLAAIGRLSQAQRETATLFYVNGYTVAEVAAVQEVPVGTVKYRLHEARERLKEDLIGMVADVLKSEAPKEDLSQRVFEAIARRGRDEHDVLVELRRMDARDGVAGLAKALLSSRSELRSRALSFVEWFDVPEHRQQVGDLLQKSLVDTNAGVRAHAAIVALTRFARDDDEMRTREFVPRVVELLFDPARRVRRAAANALLGGYGRGNPSWARAVPLAKVARAVLDETDPGTRRDKEKLLRAILDAGEREVPVTPPDVEERLRALKGRLGSPSSSVRRGAINDLLGLPMPDAWKRREVVPAVVAMLSHRSRRVRWRAAYELCSWAADVPLDVVEKACRAEPHAGTRQTMERLLRMATREQQRET